MPKSRNLGTHTRAWSWGLRAKAWARLGVGRAIYTHLPTKGMAMDVAGSLLEISNRKTDWARSTEMATEVFSPPGETDQTGSSHLESAKYPPPQQALPPMFTMPRYIS